MEYNTFFFRKNERYLIMAFTFFIRIENTKFHERKKKKTFEWNIFFSQRNRIMTTRVFFFLPSTVYQLFQRIVIDDTSEWTNAGCKVRTNLKRKRKKRHASRTIDELNLYTYILYTKHANLSITTRKKERNKL